MAAGYQLLLNGTPADASLLLAIDSLEVEENADLPGAIQIALAVERTADSDLSHVGDAGFQPFANLAVVVTPDGGSDACLFDGYVLSNKLHLETGVTNATLQIWGQDASYLMNLEEKTREWADMTDSDAASAIFGEYGIIPAADNSAEDSAAHSEPGRTLMQRGTDIQFLRQLARRTGKLCRVTCDTTPGQRTGVFASPKLDGDPAVTFILNNPTNWTVSKLDIAWDIMRPSAVRARQALLSDNDPDGADGGVSDSGLPLLGTRGLSDFAGKPVTSILTAPVDDAGELTLRSRALLRESGWFVKCEGEADAGRLGAVLRVGQVVAIEGIGSLHSGKYYVWSVRHTISAAAHTMKFTLLRNAIGAAASGGGGLLGGLL